MNTLTLIGSICSIAGVILTIVLYINSNKKK